MGYPPLFLEPPILSFLFGEHGNGPIFKGQTYLLAGFVSVHPSIHPIHPSSSHGIDRTDENSRPKVLDVDFGPCVAGTTVTGMTVATCFVVFCFFKDIFTRQKWWRLLLLKRELSFLASWCQNQPKETCVLLMVCQYQVYLSGKPLVFGDPNSEFGHSILILPSFFLACQACR